MTTVALSELDHRLTRLLAGTGLDHADAERLATYFVDAEASGRTTHGLQRLAGVLDALEAPDRAPRPTTRRHSPSVWSIEADGELGLLAVQRAVDTALGAASPTTSVIGVTGFSGTTGALGYFTEQVARAGHLCVCIVACESGVAPAGGIDPVLGTNPLSVSFPASPDPVTIDISTSALSYGTLQLLAHAGKDAPPDTVIDHEGRVSLDPFAADTGAQLPMAAHKGYGLALMIELIAGTMLGAKAGRVAVPGSDGLLLLTAPVDLFRGEDIVATDAARLLAEVRQSRPTDPARPVRVPGERSALARRTSRAAGSVEVDPALWKALVCRTDPR
jgi:L-2-hydroxycarboxylate dehydrogenase (NAD+)